MTKGAKNIPESVHRRLLDKARESSRPFNELLQYFAIERFIYRIAKSSGKVQAPSRISLRG
jgi:hypothetical protein